MPFINIMIYLPLFVLLRSFVVLRAANAIKKHYTLVSISRLHEYRLLVVFFKNRFVIHIRSLDKTYKTYPLTFLPLLHLLR